MKNRFNLSRKQLFFVSYFIVIVLFVGLSAFILSDLSSASLRRCAVLAVPIGFLFYMAFASLFRLVEDLIGDCDYRMILFLLIFFAVKFLVIFKVGAYGV